MSKASSTKLKFLSLNNQEKSLEKHPSMKTFFNQVKEKEEKEANNIINVLQSEEVEEEKIDNIDKTENINIKINIIECEYKLSDGKDIFFMETNNNNNECNIDNNTYKKINDIRPLYYGFSKNQKKLDAKITKQIYQGKNYNIIEKNFDGMLQK